MTDSPGAPGRGPEIRDNSRHARGRMRTMNTSVDKHAIGTDSTGNASGRETLLAAPVSRRSFIGSTIAAAAAGASGLLAASDTAGASSPASDSAGGGPPSFIDLLRVPDRVTVYSGLKDRTPLTRSGKVWSAKNFSVTTEVAGKSVAVLVAAPGASVTHIHVRWNAIISVKLVALGDAWERSYGDLGWRNMVPERVMPWYFATYDATSCHAYGVKTGAGALCFWQLDPEGVSLWLDVRNGGSGVQLGDRELPAATIVAREGTGDEDPIDALHAFCQQM